jgi:hypothetical protein
VLPEQGQSLGSLVCGRASSRRHGAAASSARACRLGRLILPVGRGYSPALVATAAGAAMIARRPVATINAIVPAGSAGAATRSAGRPARPRRKP